MVKGEMAKGEMVKGSADNMVQTNAVVKGSVMLRGALRSTHPGASQDAFGACSKACAGCCRFRSLRRTWPIPGGRVTGFDGLAPEAPLGRGR